VDGQPIPEEREGAGRSAASAWCSVVQLVRAQDGARQRDTRARSRSSSSTSGSAASAPTRLPRALRIADKADQYPPSCRWPATARRHLHATCDGAELMMFDERTVSIGPRDDQEVLDGHGRAGVGGTTWLVVATRWASPGQLRTGLRSCRRSHPRGRAAGPVLRSPETDRARDFLSKILTHGGIK